MAILVVCAAENFFDLMFTSFEIEFISLEILLSKHDNL